jgi:hypothetical protein
MTSVALGSLNEADIEHRVQFADCVLNHGHAIWQETLRRLYVVWGQWNREFFLERLVKPHILFSEPRCPQALGDHGRISGWGSLNQIRIRPSLWYGAHPAVRGGAEHAEGRYRVLADILLHEKIHLYQDGVALQPESGYHGPRFRDECNRIGRLLGLPPVLASKARGRDRDKSSCAQWPLAVRPEHYYLDALVPGRVIGPRPGKGRQRQSGPVQPESHHEIEREDPCGALEAARSVLRLAALPTARRRHAYQPTW